MGSKILVIEADDAFASDLASAFEGRGAEAITTGEGKDGLRLAEEAAPDAIVLCVELPRMSGYAVCNKLKKSDLLRNIPLVITSSEATEKTFEQHRKLKTRAEAYVLKPCPAEDVVAAVAGLVSLAPTGADDADAADEDLELLEDAFDALSLEDDEPAVEEVDADDLSVDVLDELETTVEVVDDEPSDTDLSSSGGEEAEDEPALEAVEAEDVEEIESEEDFEDLLGGLEVEPGTEGTEGAEAAIDALGDEDPSLGDEDDDSGLSWADEGESAVAGGAADTTDAPDTRAAKDAGHATPRASAGLEEEAARLRRERHDLQRRLDEAEDALRARTRELESARAGSASAASPKEILRLKGELTGRDREILALKESLNEKEKAALEAQERENDLELKLAELEEAALERDGSTRDLEEKASAQAERIERLSVELEEAERRADRGADAETRARDLEAEVSALRERLERAEADAERHETRLVEAYRRLKADEALRERTRKALNVALQLLDTSPESLLAGAGGAPKAGRNASEGPARAPSSSSARGPSASGASAASGAPEDEAGDDELDAAAAALAELEIESA